MLPSLSLEVLALKVTVSSMTAGLGEIVKLGVGRALIRSESASVACPPSSSVTRRRMVRVPDVMYDCVVVAEPTASVS